MFATYSMSAQVVLESGTHFERSRADVALELLQRVGGSFRVFCLLLFMFSLLWMVLGVVDEHL